MDDKTSLPLLLRILSPEGTLSEVRCEAVNLTMSDGKDGHGGGSIGVRRGHTSAVLALQKGVVLARAGEEEVFRAVIRGGFASVDHDIVTVITDGLCEE